jgi:Endonuclease/Exonuclease/phosphatase family
MRTLFPFFILLIPVFIFCQKVTERQDAGITENRAKVETALRKSQIVRVVFYNLENLYDPYDDSTKLDDEFTSKGIKRWTFSRFLVKLNHLAKTFIAIGGWEPPAMIGMCEVENRYVLNKMIYETPLKKYKYRFIHYESADARGIDVALLYRPALFKIVFSRNIIIQFPFDSLLRTRDILYVKGVLFSVDTVHLFVNHWPSRRGGFTESVPKRRVVAQTLRSALDTLQQNQVNPQIIIMGDFNDEPDQPAIREVLKAEGYTTQTTSSSLVNLMLPMMNNMNGGTIKFQGKWAILDQFMVSGNFFLKEKGLQTSPGAAYIFHPSFLMEDDERFLGGKPARTYTGPKYTGGFSDHLPVYLDVWSSRR